MATGSCYQSPKILQPERHCVASKSRQRPESATWQQQVFQPPNDVGASRKPQILQSFCDQLATGYATAGVTPSAGLVLAVSGGADSMALLYGTLQIPEFPPEKITVAHVDHALRGSESTGDASFVQQISQHLGVACKVLRLQEGALQRQGKQSLEESARHARYAFLKETAEEAGAQFVATAHHRQDQAETILHNIIRGTGLRGLTGMKPCRPLSDNTSLVRPLLDVSQEQILAFLSREGKTFRDDSSNSDVQFTRNRIRSQLMPLLIHDFNAQVEKNLIKLSIQARDALSSLETVAQQLMSESILEMQPGICRISCQPLRRNAAETVRHLMMKIWIQQHWPRQKMTFDHWVRLAEVLQSPDDTTLDLPGKLRLQVSGDIARITSQTS